MKLGNACKTANRTENADQNNSERCTIWLVSAWAGIWSIEAAYKTRSGASDVISMLDKRFVSQAFAMATGFAKGKGINLSPMQLERTVL